MLGGRWRLPREFGGRRVVADWRSIANPSSIASLSSIASPSGDDEESWQYVSSSAAASAAAAAAALAAEESVVLPPTDLALHMRTLRVGASAAPHEPRTRVTCTLKTRVDLRLTDEHCVRLLHVSSHLSSLAQRERYGRFRAPLRERAPPLPRTWWHYAYNCVASEMTRRRRWRGWPDVLAHGCRRREYLPLWRLSFSPWLGRQWTRSGGSFRVLRVRELCRLISRCRCCARHRCHCHPYNACGLLRATATTGARARTVRHPALPPPRFG